MAYRKRETPIIKTCIKCKNPFETWHIGRIYCSQACNMTAWRHRHKDELGSVETNLTTQGNLSFSLPNIATIATGSLAATAATALLNNQPNQQEIIDLINKFSHNVGRSMAHISERFNLVDDFIQAVTSEHPGLKVKAQFNRQRRLLSLKK